ncbi:MAG: DUF4349 domain-containing protein [Candidatus Sulfotelmatobacter sp.]
MNITAHPVAPEKVMAFLDGELSGPDANAVSTHVECCTECTNLAEQLRSTSMSLSAWKVPVVPTKLEESVTEAVRKAGLGQAGLGQDIGRPKLFIRTSFWTWKQWVTVGGGVVVVLLLVSAISLPNLLRSRQRVTKTLPQIVAYDKKQQAIDIGSAGALPINGRHFTNLTPLSTPRIASDSNGLFHGLGNYVGDSFSVDGQPVIDQQSKVLSNGTTAPMIARVVFLSIVVKDFPASRSSLDAILSRHRGYSAQLSVSTPQNAARSLQASLRIPAPELSASVGDIKKLGRVENESQSGEEVTQQHTDLVARLKNSRDTEQRFREILEQHTGNVGEVLQVEEGIARVRGDIERMEAEQKALEHRVDFAAIELQLTEEYEAQLNPPAPSVSTRMHNAFAAGYQDALETVFGIALFFTEYAPSFLIWLAITGLPVILVWRRYRARLAAIL